MKKIEEAINKANELFALSLLARDSISRDVLRGFYPHANHYVTRVAASYGISRRRGSAGRTRRIGARDGISRQRAVVNVFLNRTQQLCVFGTLEDVSLEIENYFQHTS